MHLLDKIAQAMRIGAVTDGEDSTIQWTDDEVSHLREMHRRKYPLVPLLDADALHSITLDMDNGPWVAGGAAIQWYRGESVFKESMSDAVHDIDIFFAHGIQEEWVKRRIGQTTKYTLVHSSSNADTYAFSSPTGKLYKVQLIKRHYFTNVDELLSSFDVRCAKIATDGKVFHAVPGAMYDINNWICRFDRYRPESVIARASKYQSYGYRVDPDFLQEIYTQENIQAAIDHDPYTVL